MDMNDEIKQDVLEQMGQDRAALQELGISIEIEKRGDDYWYTIESPMGPAMVISALLSLGGKVCQVAAVQGRETPVIQEIMDRMPSSQGIPRNVVQEVFSSVGRGMAGDIAIKGGVIARREIARLEEDKDGK